MTGPRRNLAILGSTGSIGRNALAVVRDVPDINVWSLSGCANLELLVQQAEVFRPRCVVAADAELASQFQFPLMGDVEVLVGADHLEWVASHPEVDCVLAAIVGRAGLASTLAAVEAGKRIALANKEALVAGGASLMRCAGQSGAELIPVDSEHSAIWQAAMAGRREEIERVILTASGGPFREWTREEMQHVTPEQALAHPTWDMGSKITVDSATMMNKALEIIEACWLFDLHPEQIVVAVHPQSVIHSLVEFCDGSVVAQMSPPDMKLPIQYALTYPRRRVGRAERMDWTSYQRLDLMPADPDRFPALTLGYEVAQRRGTAGAVLNAANECAVEAFLNRQIGFAEIVASCREILEQHEAIKEPTFEQILAADAWAREEMTKWIYA